MTKILITGGAGFVGHHMALQFKTKYPQWKVVAFDNLHRRGSEINLSSLKKHGVEFFHGDIRVKEDLFDLQESFDFLLEASAEPSVLAGLGGSPHYALHTNLQGTLNCLEFCRQFCPRMLFLSTSRVYSISELKSIPLRSSESKQRFELDIKGTIPLGMSAEGVNENFSTAEFRSLYGASKLCSEMMIEEYVQSYGLEAIINRCGVIAGPGQWGKVDQGVFTYWMAKHFFGGELFYTGFGGQGFQVRDLLHPTDLFTLLEKEMECLSEKKVPIYNVGGGITVSTSLQELTAICQKIAAREIVIKAKTESAAVDIPYYVSDCNKVRNELGWRAERDVSMIMREIFHWLKAHEEEVRPIFS